MTPVCRPSAVSAAGVTLRSLSVSSSDKIGYTTYDALNEFALLESAVREDLNARAIRVSAVINPVKLIITNYPEGQVEELEAINNGRSGSRQPYDRVQP